MAQTERSRQTRRNARGIEPPVVADSSVDKEMVATRDHFRVVQTGADGARTVVLFRFGSAVPRSMLDLPTLGAVRDPNAGFRPEDEGGDDV